MAAKRTQPPSPPPAPEPEAALPEYVRGEFDREAAKDYVPRAESDHAYLRTSLPDVRGFEGPLDLLLHLIRKHALDILDIPIGFITEQFLVMLDQMKAADIDIAAEFLVMAATLAHIKSKMLLPPEQVTDAEEEEEADPRAELVRRLLEYQKYKRAAEDLVNRGSMLFRDVFPRGKAGAEPGGESALTVDMTAMDLIATLEEVLRAAKVEVTHDVVFERMSVGARINEMLDLCHLVEGFTFEMALWHMTPGVPDRPRVIVTLLAILELARLKLVRVNQPAEGGTIYVTIIPENLARADTQAIGTDYLG